MIGQHKFLQTLAGFVIGDKRGDNADYLSGIHRKGEAESHFEHDKVENDGRAGVDTHRHIVGEPVKIGNAAAKPCNDRAHNYSRQQKKQKSDGSLEIFLQIILPPCNRVLLCIRPRDCRRGYTAR